ncbi:GNAT family N-acetyltransferase [Paenibacillus radicis (ex Gao et al. 2016)]|uniref:Acetyltransferase n=1 Tax=Paenibacillus radicis (ex Gao et al. 2016) TaxID=1737354 RepID=A0A917H5A8_9BACL|nr:GNAT family N-acetyltransferase [Paenibacillus radicis (ex Gao et al. 2016)]GGG67893.1 acetyltransferase [Paenibacillus radicis (ex Gao et al. 2016)]
MTSLTIEEITSIVQDEEELSSLLIKVVEDGASIGFLPPLDRAAALHYWRGVLGGDDVILFTAKLQGRIVGSIQLQLSTKPNGSHRAEIAKLMTNPDYRRQGIGRALMQAAEQRAAQENRTLLVLDTREGDPSNLLYSSLEYIQAGRIPGYARSADGQLHATIFYYKKLG